MSEVWVARHTSLDTDVVVKFLSAHLIGDPESEARFAREASAAARVKSPHVVQMLDHGVFERRPFIVMELLEGEDLHDRLAREHTLPLRTAVSILAQVGRALSRAHERGVVHRDIKPANIFLCEHGGSEPFVKVLDFGIAKAPGGSLATVSGTVIGTPSFMSPEQLIGSRDVDWRADLWALAAVGYCALTGRLPFEGDSIGALALAVHSKRPPPPSTLGRSIPPALDAWFARAFGKLEERFASADQMIDALNTASGIGPGGAAAQVSTALAARKDAKAEAEAVGHEAAAPLADTVLDARRGTSEPVVTQPPVVLRQEERALRSARLPWILTGGALAIALGAMTLGRGTGDVRRERTAVPAPAESAIAIPASAAPTIAPIEASSAQTVLSASALPVTPVGKSAGPRNVAPPRRMPPPSSSARPRVFDGQTDERPIQ